MGQFVKGVRKRGGIRNPTQRGFDREKWSAVFRELAPTDEDDARLHRAGLWFDTLLDQTRSVWTEADVSSREGVRLARHFVGELNRLAVVLNQRMAEHRGAITSEELVALQVPTSENTRDAQPDAIVAMTVDGARLVLSALLSASSPDATTGLADDEMLKRAKVMALLAQAYGSFEDIWRECVWNSWGVETRDSRDCVLGASRRDDMRAVGDFRLNLLMVELSTIAIGAWRMVCELGGGLGDCFPVVAMSDPIGGSIEISSATWNAEEPNEDIAAVLMVERLGLYEILADLPVAELEGLALRHVFRAWQVLRAVARAQQAKLPDDTAVNSVAEMERFAPALDKETLVNLLRSWIKGLSEGQANSLLRFLTFVPNGGELWDAPLVECAGEGVLLVHPAVLFGNPLRALELWMSRGGVSYETRGHAFEDEVERALKEGMAGNEIWGRMRTGVDKRVEVGSGEDVEEFDVVLQMENWIWILEVKCLNFPVSAVEISNYFESLENAATQAIRKCERARREPGVALAAMRLSDAPDPSAVRFRPLIAVNGALGAGFDVAGVPVADLAMLEAYLRGKIDVDVMFVAGEPQSSGREFVLYLNEDEAIEHLPHYLARPPQIERLKHYTWQIDALPPAGDGRERFVARRTVDSGQIEVLGSRFVP